MTRNNFNFNGHKKVRDRATNSVSHETNALKRRKNKAYINVYMSLSYICMFLYANAFSHSSPNILKESIQ
jgi:hypothetical protein